MTRLGLPADFQTIFSQPQPPAEEGAGGLAFSPLGPLGDEEPKFRRWYEGWSIMTGLSSDPDDRRHFYDYRKAYLSGAEPDSFGHWPSEFKHPGHPNRFVDGVDTLRIGKDAPPAPDRDAIPRDILLPGPPTFLQSVKREFSFAMASSTAQGLGELIGILPDSQVNENKAFMRDMRANGIIEKGFNELDDFVEGQAPPGMERGEGVGGFIGSAAGTVLFDFGTPILMGATIFKISARRSTEILDETGSYPAAITGGTIAGFGTLLFFKLLGKRGQKAGGRYKEAYAAAAKRGEPALQRALLAGDREAAIATMRGIAADTGIGLGGGVLISEATLAADQFSQVIWNAKDFNEAVREVQLKAPEEAIEAFFSGLFIFGAGAVGSALLSRRNAFTQAARDAKSEAEVSEVLRQAKDFVNRHAEAQQWVSNAPFDQLAKVRTRFAGRADSHSVGMTMLIDARLASEAGGRIGPPTAAEVRAMENIRRATRQPRGDFGERALPGRQWPLADSERGQLRTLGWADVELEARPEAVFWRGILNRNIRNPEPPLSSIQAVTPEQMPRAIRVSPARDMEIRENYYDGPTVVPLVSAQDLTGIRAAAERAAILAGTAKGDPLFKTGGRELVSQARKLGVDVEGLELEVEPRAGKPLTDADRAKLIRAIRAREPGEEAPAVTERPEPPVAPEEPAGVAALEAPVVAAAVAKAPVAAPLAPVEPQLLPFQMTAADYEAQLLQQYPDGMLPTGFPINAVTVQELQELSRAGHEAMENGEPEAVAPPAATPVVVKLAAPPEAARIAVPTAQETEASLRSFVEDQVATPPNLARTAELAAATVRARQIQEQEAETDFEGKRQRLLSAASDAKLVQAQKFTREQAERFLQRLEAAPGDDQPARAALHEVHPGLVTGDPEVGRLPFDEPPGPRRGTQPPTRRGMIDQRLLDVPARKAVGIVRGGANLFTGFTDFAWMDVIDDVRRQGGDVGNQLADMAEADVSMTKRIWGELADGRRAALDAIRRNPAASFRLQEIAWDPGSPAGNARFMDAAEGIEPATSSLMGSELRFILAWRSFMQLTGGKLAEHDFRQRNRATGQLETFQPEPDGLVFLRSPTGYLFDLYANPEGPVWELYIEAIRSRNGWTPEQTRRVLGQLTKANFHRIGPELSRLIPNHPTHIRDPGGQQYPLLHTQPTSAVLNASRSVAMRIGFVSQFGQGFAGDVIRQDIPRVLEVGVFDQIIPERMTLAQLRTAYIDAKGSATSFDRLMRVLSGLDTMAPLVAPGQPGYEFGRTINTAMLGIRSTMLTRASVPNTVEPVGNIRAWAGNRRFLLAMGDMIRLSPDHARRLRESGVVPEDIPVRSGFGELTRLMNRLGLVGEDLMDITVDRDRWIASAVRRYGDAILRIFPTRQVWTWQENLGAATALRVANEIAEGRGSALDYLTARALDFDKETANLIAMGLASNEVAIDYARRYATQTNTTRMTLPAEESRAVNNRFWRAFIWFSRYPFMKGRTFSKDVQVTHDALKTFVKEPTRRNGNIATAAGIRFLSGILGTTVAGEAYQLILAWVMGGKMGLLVRLREQREDPIISLGEAWITGMAGPILSSVINIARRRDVNTWWRVSPAASFGWDLVAATFSSLPGPFRFGLGEFADLDRDLIWAKFARRYAPGPRALQSLLGLRGIGRKNPQMETAISAMYRFRRRAGMQVARTQIFQDEEASIAFRNEMRRAYTLLKSNDILDPKVIEDVEEIIIRALAVEVGTGEATTVEARRKFAVGLRRRKLLPEFFVDGALNKGLNEFGTELLRIEGEAVFLQLLEHDLIMERWATAVEP